EPEDKGWWKFGYDGEKRKRTDLYPKGRGRALHDRPIFLGSKPGQRMQAGVGDIESEIAAEQFVELLDKKGAAFGINLPHPSNVAQVIAFRDETGQGGLIDRGRVLVDGGAKLRDGIRQTCRNQQVSE